ncbi:MAG: hypothetical protein GX603_05710 [Chloroflexi bacterium]|nr:hypothetical protein [Chloroflexota bacterium]
MNSFPVEEAQEIVQKPDLLHKITAYVEKNSPGMRVVKTALAIIICLVIEYYRGSSTPYHACVATIVCMQPTLKSSFQSAVDRTLGTIIAGIYAYILAVLFGQTWGIQPTNISFYLLVGFLSFPLMAIMIIIKKPSSLAITAIVYLVIMLTITDNDPLTYTFMRVVATLIGISVALFVNWLPPLNKIGKKMQTIQ